MNRTMRVHVTEVHDGDIIIKDIFNENGVNIISAGTIIRDRDIAILKRHNIDMLDIMERVSPQSNIDTMTLTAAAAELKEATPASVHDRFFPRYEEALKDTNLLFNHAQANGVIVHEVVENTITPLLEEFKKERDVVSLLLQLNSEDDYTCQQSIKVSMLSYFLATWLGYSPSESLRIGKAGYLHDIGKCRIDQAILNKPSPLTPDEFEQMKKHTIAGHEIINASYNDDWLSFAALQHHERMNGSGYPLSLTGDQIHKVAKIVAVADVYSAMISKRAYREKQDLFSVLKELYQMSFDQLDPVITHTFIRYMLPNFLHKQVVLTDGRTGIIVMNHNTEFFRPLVRVDQQFIDLSQNRKLEIERVLHE